MAKKTNLKVTKVQLKIAELSGISAPTVYQRLSKGWDLADALLSPSQRGKRSRKTTSDGVGHYKKVPERGRGRSFRLDKELDTLADQAIAASGLTMAEWFSRVVRSHFDSAEDLTKDGQGGHPC
jgi:hypothetical protein